MWRSPPLLLFCLLSFIFQRIPCARGRGDDTLLPRRVRHLRQRGGVRGPAQEEGRAWDAETAPEPAHGEWIIIAIVVCPGTMTERLCRGREVTFAIYDTRAVLLDIDSSWLCTIIP